MTPRRDLESIVGRCVVAVALVSLFAMVWGLLK